MNGSGTLSLLKTAAYPERRMVPSSAWRASTFLIVKVRRSIFFVILLLESSSASSASIFLCAQFCARSLKFESPPHKSQATNPAPGYPGSDGLLFFGASPSTLCLANQGAIFLILFSVMLPAAMSRAARLVPSVSPSPPYPSAKYSRPRLAFSWMKLGTDKSTARLLTSPPGSISSAIEIATIWSMASCLFSWHPIVVYVPSASSLTVAHPAQSLWFSLT